MKVVGCYQSIDERMQSLKRVIKFRKYGQIMIMKVSFPVSRCNRKMHSIKNSL